MARNPRFSGNLNRMGNFRFTSSNNKFFVANPSSNPNTNTPGSEIYPDPGFNEQYGKARIFPNADVAQAYKSAWSRYMRAQGLWFDVAQRETIGDKDALVHYFASNTADTGYWKVVYEQGLITNQVTTEVKGSLNTFNWSYQSDLPLFEDQQFNINTITPGFTQDVNFAGIDTSLEYIVQGIYLPGQTYDDPGFIGEYDISGTNINLVSPQALDEITTTVDLAGVTINGTNFNNTNLSNIIYIPGSGTYDVSGVDWETVSPDLINYIQQNGYNITLNNGEITAAAPLTTGNTVSLPIYEYDAPLDPLVLNVPGGIDAAPGTTQQIECTGEGEFNVGEESLSLEAPTVNVTDHEEELLCEGTACIAEKVYVPDKKLENGADKDPEDIDKPTVYLGVTPSEILPDDETAFTFTFRRTGELDRPLTIRYEVTGSAGISDYFGATPGKETITLDVNEETKSIVITPIVITPIEQTPIEEVPVEEIPVEETPVEDQEDELYKTIDIKILKSNRYYVGTTSKVTGTIQNFGDPEDPCYALRKAFGDMTRLAESKAVIPYGTFTFPVSYEPPAQEGGTPTVEVSAVIGWNLRYTLETVEVGVEPPPEDPPPPEEVISPEETVPPEDAPSCTWYEASEAEYNALAIGSTISWTGIGNGEIVRGKSILADGIYMILGCVE